MLDRRRDLDLALVLALALGQLIVSIVPTVGGPLRIATGLPAVVFAPGYALTAAIWPDGRLAPIERLVLSLGLSLSLAALGGLALNVIGVGLWPVPWAVLLGLPMVIGGLLALWRRRGLPVSPSPSGDSAHPSHRPGLLGVLLWCATLATTASGVAIAVASASQPSEDFSQLWLLPVSNANGGSVEVGLQSHELQTTSFHLQVLDGSRVALDTPDVRLTPGQTWTTTIQLPSPSPDQSTSDSIQALVYRSDAPDTPYRRAQLLPADTQIGQ